MSTYQSFTLEVDDETVGIIAGALFAVDLRGYMDDTVRVRRERVYKDRVYEVLERAHTLKTVKNR